MNLYFAHCSRLFAIIALGCLLFISASVASPLHERNLRVRDAAGRNLLKRELIITMLDGSPPNSRFVNLLDQWEVAEKGLRLAPEGSERQARIVRFMEAKGTQLMNLMEGIAILQSRVPNSPTATTSAVSTDTFAEPTPSPEDTETRDDPRSETTATEVSEGPEVTVIPQGNHNTVVLETEGRTITRVLGGTAPSATAGSASGAQNGNQYAHSASDLPGGSSRTLSTALWFVSAAWAVVVFLM